LYSILISLSVTAATLPWQIERQQKGFTGVHTTRQGEHFHGTAAIGRR